MDRQVVISIRTVIFTLLMLLAAYIIYRLRGIISLVLIALLIVISLEPLVKFFMKKVFFNRHLSRSFSVILAYVLLISLLASVLTLGLPPVIDQTQTLLSQLGVLLQDISNRYGVEVSFENFASQLSAISGGVVSFTLGLFSNITTVLSVLILSIYMSLDWENLKARLLGLLPERYENDAHELIDSIENGVGHWVKGQILLMVVVGLLSFFGLFALQVEHALALGILSGFLEIVPILGPLISAILAAIIAFADSPLKGAAVLGLFFIIQQLENNFLVPKIMQKVSGFSPLVILIALLIGSNFFGIIGAILSVPIVMIAVIIIKKILTYSSAGSE